MIQPIEIAKEKLLIIKLHWEWANHLRVNEWMRAKTNTWSKTPITQNEPKNGQNIAGQNEEPNNEICINGKQTHVQLSKCLNI